jgi:hypothetical protein
MRLLRSISLLTLVLVATLAPAAGQGRQRGEGRPPRMRADPTVLDRLEEMTPEQRRQALEKLPPERRRRLQERLERYERLSPEERERLRQRYDRFRALAPERQQAARLLFERFRQLPDQRRIEVRRAVRRLSLLNPSLRRERMNQRQFRARFTPEERAIIADFLQLGPPW